MIGRSSQARSVRAAAVRFVPLFAALLGAAALSAAAWSQAQPHTMPREVDAGWHALIGATLVPEPGSRVENATVVIRDGVIVSARADAAPPAGARVWDYTGLTLYAGFIEPHAPVDAPAIEADAPGAHWNALITPQRIAASGKGLDTATRKALRDMGFASAVIAPKEGILRGRAALVSLFDDAPDGQSLPRVIRDGVYMSAAFESAGRRAGSYPGSQMGAIALFRQTMLDAQWRADDLAAYERNPARRAAPAPASALDAINAFDGPIAFVVSDELEALRATRLASEFDVPAIVMGDGSEYRRLDAIAAQNTPFVVPLNFPATPRVSSLADAESVDLRTLMTWEQAPTNPRRLHDAGVSVSLTTDRLRRRADFHANLRKAIEHGLHEDHALAMLTTNPASMLGVQDRMGRIAPGMLANIVVSKGGVFEKDAEIRDVWVAGRRFEIKAPPSVEPEGEWEAAFPAPAPFGAAPDEGRISIKKGNRITLHMGDKKADARGVRVAENRVSFLIDADRFGATGVLAFQAVIDGDDMIGTLQDADDRISSWSATRVPPDVPPEADAPPEAPNAADEDKKNDAPAAPEVPETYGLPFGPYALDAIPEQRHLRFVNATLWTCGPEGIIENGELEIRDGRIVYAGAARRAGGASASGGGETIDLAGRHITPGIIDCHSHTGISGGVNEGTHAITAEVRIADVINPDAISWYRQLAGGVTLVNQLHGSANPIGGQNSVVKNRWGVAHPDDMLVEGAIGGIKFALGENVKQSNWGERFTTRYPQSRMGVETFMRDAFTVARDYREQHRRHSAMSAREREGVAPPRRDLQLDALVEILEGDRLVHCHSYRQDEILMLARLAQHFGFTIGTFQHILEGYKVAEAIKATAIGASAFSDWWAFKIEVIDAIPEAGAIMHEVGVNVSFNSDSDELARRMHAEAAKAVKYGSVDPHEALKFVTLNPAIQLGIQDRVGSLEPGKDADFVVWSGEPLSSMSRPLATYIDGREYFSVERDAAHREHIQRERMRIIGKIRAEGARAAPKREEPAEDATPQAEETDEEPTSAHEREHQRHVRLLMLDLLRSGQDPDAHRCGECGILDLTEHAHHH
ncbi:MAG: amidohydrolase [Phycisphaerales bacterium]|nr:MAG: amidohydrolase [Phycisphaerales bacterium]